MHFLLYVHCQHNVDNSAHEESAMSRIMSDSTVIRKKILLHKNHARSVQIYRVAQKNVPNSA